MEVLITSVTKIGEESCIGGICLSDLRMIRLLGLENQYQPKNSELKIGGIWDIEFDNGTSIIPPHVEDVIIKSKTFLRKIENIREYILDSGVHIYQGPPDKIFGGLLKWTGNGNGFFNKESSLPDQSVGFWISDQDLTFNIKHFYYQTGQLDFPFKRVPYVGYEQPLEQIKAGTLMRISTAKWWKPKNKQMELRCYLQLSGWYL